MKTYTLFLSAVKCILKKNTTCLKYLIKMHHTLSDLDFDLGEGDEEGREISHL